MDRRKVVVTIERVFYAETEEENVRQVRWWLSTYFYPAWAEPFRPGETFERPVRSPRGSIITRLYARTRGGRRGEVLRELRVSERGRVWRGRMRDVADRIIMRPWGRR